MILTNSTNSDCNIIELPKIHNRAGNLTAINNTIDIPFEVKRIYYIFDIPGGSVRGGHAHKNLKQLIIAASGSFDVILDDGRNKEKIFLNRPYFGLLVIPGIWREILNFSSGAICLVLASEKYYESDYIRRYIDFLNYKQNEQVSSDI
jgi:dTDP-4-dehydrorhamnose 3,5-epimerase-like enzyme